MISIRKFAALAAGILLLITVPIARAQAVGGAIAGTVSLDNGDRLHKAIILLPQLGRRAESNDLGEYRFNNVPPGTYAIVARASGFGDIRRSVMVSAGQTTAADFTLTLAAVREEITVTASGREETAYESFQAVSTLNSIELVREAEPSIGEALETQPGVAKRSFGPGSARPVIRGFDGDRVLVMRDGLATGSLSSQSADHGEPMNVLGLERLEVVKGPATLLYGSSAIGGVVNAITPNEHFQEHTHEGATGYLSGVGGSTNDMGNFGGGVQVGYRDWAFWGNGSGQRTGDYKSPAGTVLNSATRSVDGTGGFGWLGKKAYFNLTGGASHGRYGIPFAGEFHHHENGGAGNPNEPHADVDVAMRRWNTRFAGGLRELHGPISDLRVLLDYADYRHEEIEIDDGAEETGTRFSNRSVNYRGIFNQKQMGIFSGSFGFSGMHRAYKATGDEALSPPVDQMNFAVFALEQVTFKRIGFQFGGRMETNRYDAHGATDRTFTGFSGAAGFRVPLWEGGAFVGNYTHSYRAPALEELYNNGPHIGNLAFEIGNGGLQRELGNGIDVSLRHNGDRLRIEGNVFLYRLSDFIFLAPTGDEEEGLVEAEYLQGNSRFVGGEASAEIGLHRNVWLHLGMDIVNAELRENVASLVGGVGAFEGIGLPRIPPLRGRAGVEFRYKGISVTPSLVAVDAAEHLFPNETRTPGYTVVDLDSSFTYASKHTVHVFSMKLFNLGDRLYRNHLSFIKDLAPEMGRGVRFGYTLRFF